MAFNEEEFNNLISEIKNGSFKSTDIELEGKGLTDYDVKLLITTINADPELSSRLQLINLADNYLTLPPDLSKFINLEYIYLQGNQLTIPPVISTCAKLQGLGLGDNPLTTLGKLAVEAIKRRNLIVGVSGDLAAGQTANQILFDEHLHAVFNIFWQQQNLELDAEVIINNIQNYILKNNPSPSELIENIINEYILKTISIETLDEYITENIKLLFQNLKHKTSFVPDLEVDKKLRKIIELSAEPFIFATAEQFAAQKNLSAAKKYYLLLTEQPYNNIQALYNLAEILELENNITEAKASYLKAARFGHTEAKDKVIYFINNNPKIPKPALDIIKCNISLDVMINPVTTASGQSYEESEINQWRLEHDLDHIGKPIVSLIPNHTLAGLIDHMLMHDGDIVNYPGLKNSGVFFENPCLNAQGVTVEKNDTDPTLRPDFVLRNLISYIKKQGSVLDSNLKNKNTHS